MCSLDSGKRVRNGRCVWAGVAGEVTSIVIDLGFKILQSNAAALDEVQKQKTDDVDIMMPWAARNISVERILAHKDECRTVYHY